MELQSSHTLAAYTGCGFGVLGTRSVGRTWLQRETEIRIEYKNKSLTNKKRKERLFFDVRHGLGCDLTVLGCFQPKCTARCRALEPQKSTSTRGFRLLMCSGGNTPYLHHYSSPTTYARHTPACIRLPSSTKKKRNPKKPEETERPKRK